MLHAVIEKPTCFFQVLPSPNANASIQPASPRTQARKIQTCTFLLFMAGLVARLGGGVMCL